MPTAEHERDEMQEGFDRVTHGVTHAQLDGLEEKAVRYSLAKGEYGAPGTTSHEIALSWLASKDAERATESLSISRRALRNSDRATTIAIIAMVLSVIMAIQKIIEWYSK